MAADSYGSQDQPIFAETGAPQLGTDLSLISQYAALTGNRKIGTTSARLALTGADVWEGLVFWDTSYDHDFVYDGSGWVGDPTYNGSGSGSVTMYSNWTLTSAEFTTKGNIIQARFYVTRTSGITGNSSGNIGNVQILTINDTDKRPMHSQAFVGDGSGYHCSFYCDADGTVAISSLPAGISAVNGDVFSFSATYIRAVG